MSAGGVGINEAFVTNEMTDVGADVRAAPSEVLAFHRSLPGYAPTPLRDVPSLARLVGVREVLVKDESRRLGLPAFKVLGASWAVHRRLAEGAAPPRRLVTATDGNHGRGVACVARWNGFEAAVFVPAVTVRARIEAIQSEGARVTVVDGDYDEAVAAARASVGDGDWIIQDTSWSGYEDVPRRVIEGYSTMFREIDETLSDEGGAGPDLVIVQVGVGSLAAAAAVHYACGSSSRRPQLLGVEPIGADCLASSFRARKPVEARGPHASIMAGLNCGTVASVAWPALQATFAGCAVIDDDCTREAMRLFAAAGIESGESGAAGLGALLALRAAPKEAQARYGFGPDARVLVLNTEGMTDPESYRRIVGADAPCTPVRG